MYNGLVAPTVDDFDCIMMSLVGLSVSVIAIGTVDWQHQHVRVCVCVYAPDTYTLLVLGGDFETIALHTSGYFTLEEVELQKSTPEKGGKRHLTTTVQI